MGGRISIDMCPGEHRYIDRLNDTIHYFNGIKDDLEQKRKNLVRDILDLRDRVIQEDIRQIIYLILSFYRPLFSTDNAREVRMPRRIDFSKKVVHREKAGFRTLSNPQDEDEDEDEDIEYWYKKDSEVFEHLVAFLYKNRELELEDVPLEFLLGFKAKKDEFDSLKEEFEPWIKEGFCEREERDIRDKKNEIDSISNHQIPDLNDLIPRLVDYLTILRKQHDIYQAMLRALEKTRDEKRLTIDNQHDVEKPQFTQYEIAGRLPTTGDHFVGSILKDDDVEPFEPEIHYGNKSGVYPKADAYEYLYRSYYDALGRAYSIIDNHLQPGVDYLKKTELTGLDYSFETVRNENALIKKQITDNNIRLSTDTKKFFYQTDSFVYLKSVNFCLFILFYILFLFFVYSVYQSVEITFYYKIMYVILVFLYPFLIKPLEGIFWFLLVFIYSLTFGQIYTGKV